MYNKYDKAADQYTLKGQDITLDIDLLEGMNVNAISFKSKNIIHFDKSRKKAGGTYAVPVLFPTPNRTEDLHYKYGKKDIIAVMHGFLRHSAFTLEDKKENKIRAYCEFDGNNELFPYEGRMTIEVSIIGDAVFWLFNFSNLSDEKLAYNLALHPFFTKAGLKRIEVGVKEEMLNKETLIPTGETVPRERIDIPADEVSMDTVFIMGNPFNAVMHYDNFDIEFSASEDFRHTVIFSAPEKEFLCIEPQTGSTDAHNLHAKGFKREAGLIEVKPGEDHTSWFCLNFRQTQQGDDKMKNFCFNADIPAKEVDPGVTRKILAYSDDLMVCELHFKKGAVGKLHHHIHEQISYVVSGAFEFTIDGVTKIVRAGDALHKQPNVEHGAVCIEEGCLIDIFTPKRDDFLK